MLTLVDAKAQSEAELALSHREPWKRQVAGWNTSLHSSAERSTPKRKGKGGADGVTSQFPSYSPTGTDMALPVRILAERDDIGSLPGKWLWQVSQKENQRLL